MLNRLAALDGRAHLGDEVMPTNRRKLSRKHHAFAEAEAWETYMMLGTDWFHDLDRAGYSPEDIEREAPGVWHRHGARQGELAGVWMALAGELTTIFNCPRGLTPWGYLSH